ncbi:MAG: enoyl-CoA hydratase-related protein, partial [Pseudomonadota bacterium]|nr:enoyl-CoA hydratase-related protein [Pseudomonadota bacterium]
MSYEHILTDLDDDGILTVTLHRPEAMNAWTMTMTKELVDMVEKADANDDVRAVVVTGSGERTFCAGADLSSGVDTFQSALIDDTDGLNNDDGTINWGHPGIRDTAGLFNLKVYNSLKPYICAINGVAVGVGVTMTLPMDIRIASDNARFGF